MGPAGALLRRTALGAAAGGGTASLLPRCRLTPLRRGAGLAAGGAAARCCALIALYPGEHVPRIYCTHGFCLLCALAGILNNCYLHLYS